MDSKSEANQVTALIISMVATLSNKIKICVQYPLKNKQLAQDKDFRNLIHVLTEQLLPQWCAANVEDRNKINNMHNLWYLLAYKTQQVFFSRVIHTCIDQNWDLKGLKQVLLRILKTLEITGFDPLITTLDKLVQN